MKTLIFICEKFLTACSASVTGLKSGSISVSYIYTLPLNYFRSLPIFVWLLACP